MKSMVALLTGVLMIPVPTFCQTQDSDVRPKMRGGLDKGCPQTSFFAQSLTISGEDFIELKRASCFANCPLFTVRVYGDGRVVWHGDKRVDAIGDATARIDAGQAHALLANALKLGFGSLCKEYVMQAFDGRVSVTSLRVGGQVKTVSDTTPNAAPVWFHQLQKQVESMEAVQGLIGVQRDPAPPPS